MLKMMIIDKESERSGFNFISTKQIGMPYCSSEFPALQLIMRSSKT